MNPEAMLLPTRHHAAPNERGTLGDVSKPFSGNTVTNTFDLDSALLDKLPIMIWTAGRDRSVRYFNARWLAFRGHTLAEECRTGEIDGIHPDDSAQRQALFQERFELRCQYETEYRLQRHDGTYEWISESAAPWFSPSGRFLGYVGCCLHIDSPTPASRIPRNREDLSCTATDEMERFTVLASHDLQEPLRTVATYSEMLVRRCSAADDPHVRECFAFLSGAVGRMRILVQSLLDYAHTGHHPAFTEVDLNTAVKLATQSCQAAMQESKAVLIYDALPKVRADESQLVQVLQNLISNAIKYRRPDVKPRIHIQALDCVTEWLVRVSDNGTGFEAQYAEQIFSAFQRLHQRHCSGSGLGLAICRKIIDQHGGRIWADAQPGVGAQFCFTLPRGRIEELLLPGNQR